MIYFFFVGIQRIPHVPNFQRFVPLLLLMYRVERKVYPWLLSELNSTPSIWWKYICRKVDFDLERSKRCTKRFCVVFYSSRGFIHKTFPRKYKSQPNSFLEEWQMRPNSDFMFLDAWMSISRNFRIQFH